MKRRLLTFALGGLLFSCRSQPATPTVASVVTPTPAPALSAVAEPSSTPAGLSVAAIERNVAGMKSVLVADMCWCTFGTDKSLDCAYSGEGMRETGSWWVNGGSVWSIQGNGPRPFEWKVDYVSENVVHLDLAGTEAENPFGIYCDEKRTCDKWSGPLVAIQDASAGNTAVAKVKSKLAKHRPKWVEGDESWWNGIFVVDGGRAAADVQGSHIRVSNRDGFGDHAKQLAADLERDLGRVEIVDGSSAPFDILVTIGNGVSKPPRLRVAVRDGVCTDASGDWCSGNFHDRIAERVTTEKFVGVLDGRVKEARTLSEIWFMPGREAEAEELRALLTEYTDVAPKKWEWGGDFDLLVIAGSKKVE